MQLTGTQFTNTSAVVGNDISTLPDFPAEIRAPAGSLPGVSGFQLNFSSQDIKTPGDQPNVLVAMNPGRVESKSRRPGRGRHADRQHRRLHAGEFEVCNYAANPLEDNSLAGYRVHKLPISTLNMNALKGNVELSRKEIDRSKTSSRSACSTGSTTGRWRTR
jgi:2-oxoglutarate ferredoxin oxidoreductase subunit alpha